MASDASTRPSRRIDPPLPGLILAEDLGADRDVIVYENAMAYIQNGEKLELISVGEMVQIGNVWKLVDFGFAYQGNIDDPIIHSRLGNKYGRAPEILENR